MNSIISQSCITFKVMLKVVASTLIRYTIYLQPQKVIQMKTSILKYTLTVLLSTAVLTAGISTAQADDKKKPEKKQADKKKKTGFFPFRGLIKSVDVGKKTITLPGGKGKPDRVFFVTDTTKLRGLDKKATKLKDIKSGQFVGGRAKKRDDGKSEATTINLRPKPEPRKKPKKTDK